MGIMLEFLTIKIAVVNAFIKFDLPEAFAPYITAVFNNSSLLKTKVFSSFSFPLSFSKDKVTFSLKDKKFITLNSISINIPPYQYYILKS